MQPDSLAFADSVEWPNGEGYTECTTEYATLHDNFLAAREACEDADEDECGFTDLAVSLNDLDRRLGALRAQGHLGNRIRYSARCALSAILGGAQVSA